MEEDPEEFVLQQERLEDIELALNELLPLYKELLIMKYELELSYQEISDLLGIRVNQVKSALFRARKQFQKKYRGER
ncbi:RNA polymerase sigma-H factor [compost metagenome]